MTYRNGKALQVPASTVQPAESIVQPAESTVQPAESTVQPAESTVQPAESTVQPAESTVQPAESTVQPAESIVQPAKSTVQPAKSTVQPAKSTVLSAAEKSQRNLAHFTAKATIDTRLVAAQVMIDKVLGNPQLQARMAAHGYSAARMLHGRALRDQALALQHQQQAAYGAQIAATDARIALQSQAKASYTHHVTKARVALRENRGAAYTLELGTIRKRNRAGWLIQAQQFYLNLLADPALVASMTEYGVTYEQLAAAQQALVAVEAALTAQQDTKDAAKAAIRARNVELEALSRWMQDFQAIARVELAEQKHSEASNLSSSS